MNHGFFGFPNILNPSENAVAQFDSNGAYTISPKTKKLYIFAIGGGGGGGGGARNSLDAYGGGGGSGGAFVLLEFNVYEWGGPGQTLIISIGSGGGGGAAAIGDSSSGGNGSPGNATSITISGKPGILIYCAGGAAGNGGTTASATGGAGVLCYLGLSSATADNGANSNGSITLNSMFSHGGAGGGAKLSTPNTGGSIILSASTTTAITNPLVVKAGTLYSGGSTESTTAPRNPSQHILGILSPGVGGPGGGSGTTAANSGARGFRGSGGGGGGGAGNGIEAGTGGAGGNGYACIIAI